MLLNPAAWVTLTADASAKRLARSVWMQARFDPAWPLADGRERTWCEWLSQRQAEAAMSWSGFRFLVRPSGQPVGFLTLNRIEPHWLPDGITAVEAGTYLVPRWRGSGWNLVAKQVAVHLSGQLYRPDWLVYAVPAANDRAIRGLVQIQPALPRVAGSVLSRWTRYLAWKHSQPVCLFAFAQDSPAWHALAEAPIHAP
ncbi:MAG: hypothetical protein K6T78_04625 [Alicyclobacillus sp.]|nr:hypothetical protein [Alicyclobacillus sp.]